MHINAKTDYAVRACVELASCVEVPDEPARWVKADALAARQGVPVPFMLSILNELKRAGVVESRRGADGGYRLARPPAATTIADVVRAIDGPLADVAGSYVEDVAYGGGAAAVRDVWVALRAAMRTVLEHVSLEQAARGALPEHVRALLADDAAWSTRPHGRSAIRP